MPARRLFAQLLLQVFLFALARIGFATHNARVLSAASNPVTALAAKRPTPTSFREYVLDA